MNNTKEMLEDMRKLTMLTGSLSKVHEENLQKWPYIAFDDVVEAEIKYDLSKDYTKENGEGYMTFYIDTGHDQGNVKNRADHLTSWVRDMFWADIKVSVFLDGKEVYKNSSKTNEANPKQLKEEKSYSELFKEVKNGPKHDW